MLSPLLRVDEADALLVALRAVGLLETSLCALGWDASLKLLAGVPPLNQSHGRKEETMSWKLGCLGESLHPRVVQGSCDEQPLSKVLSKEHRILYTSAAQYGPSITCPTCGPAQRMPQGGQAAADIPKLIPYIVKKSIGYCISTVPIQCLPLASI